MKDSEIFDDYLKLKAENVELKNKLSAKKYKMIDEAVAFIYRLLPFVATARFKKIQNKNKIEIKPLKKSVRKRKIVAKKVYIINFRFYDYAGEVVHRGGAERYVYDLAKLLITMGYDPILLQLAKQNFSKTYKGIKVQGIEAPENITPEDASAIYNKFCQDAELIIASPMELAVEIEEIPVIAINHGVNFDTPRNDLMSTAQYNIHARAIARSRATVCVDTNFINWIRTNSYHLADDLHYVPNYYDAKVFKPTKRDFINAKKIRCVYPRRIYAARGYDITIKAFESLLKKYKEKLELSFVGQVDNKQAEEDLEKLMKKFPERVKQYSVDPDEMPKVYAKTDIALVPTKYSEETSLSCIEAMASGCVVIATNVGGLPNIVLDHYNGLLVAPNAKALENAVTELIEDRNLMKKLVDNGARTASAGFSKELWDKRWRMIIETTLAETRHQA